MNKYINCSLNIEKLKHLLDNYSYEVKKPTISIEQLDKVDNYYFDKIGKFASLINNAYSYNDLESLLLDIKNQIKENRLHVSMIDFKNMFLHSKLINRRIVSLSLFHYIEFENSKKMILLIYINKARPLRIIHEQLNLFYSLLDDEIDLILDIKTVEYKKDERVEFFYC